MTIKADNTEAENEIRKEIKALNEKWDDLYNQKASDEELNNLENEIDLLYKKLD